MYKQISNSIEISVTPEYLDEQSIPEEYYYVWAYHITIQNLGLRPVTLKSRYWEIVDSNGKKQVVEGEGVIGKQPTIKPGERFSYSSGTPLNSTSGIMKGNYKMLSDDGQEFLAKIPSFSLDLPLRNKKLN
tara:strand:+ start:1314 stop:1706 length:393 start_codon:yes stop_codon:yes gene_type:complete